MTQCPLTNSLLSHGQNEILSYTCPSYSRLIRTIGGAYQTLWPSGASPPRVTPCFAGFIGTHLLSEARERGKELRAMLDKLFTRLRELEDQARTFHTSSAYDQEGARQLREAVQQVSRQFSRCRVVTESAPFQ